MTWVTWRQQRTEVLIAAGILALVAAVLIPTGIEMASAYHHDGLSACLGQATSSSCDDAIHVFTGRFESLGNLLAWFTLVPGLIGVVLAAPFVLELENGTHRLAWTQSITRRRWISSKLALTVGGALLAALVLTRLMTWWHTPLDHLNGRMDNSVYDTEGIVVFGYTLFALGLALAVGVLWRRTIPAVVIAFVGYFAARITVDTWLRQRLVTPLSATWRASAAGPGGPGGGNFAPASLNHAWVLTERPTDRLGHPISLKIGPCARGAAGHVKNAILNGNCIVQNGENYMHAVYQPASRFWLLQGIETSLFGGTALALILFAAWWTHQRAA
jgi:hypothetical protein